MRLDTGTLMYVLQYTRRAQWGSNDLYPSPDTSRIHMGQVPGGCIQNIYVL